MTVEEIYKFVTDNFPYFRNADDQWKNSLRHSLSMKSFFKKIDPAAVGVPTAGRKRCFWTLVPDETENIEAEFQDVYKTDPSKIEIKKSMAMPP